MECSSDVRLFSYKLKHDSGFAPNPFHGFCTLATCKPQIRKSKVPGDWIAGFTSRTLNRDEVGFERLVYLMRITEKLSLGDYYFDERFRAKIPLMHSNRRLDLVGDNIYRWEDGGYTQILNRSHGHGDAETDVSGVCALISMCFYYFGSRPLLVPGEVRPSVPPGVSAHGARTHDGGRAIAFLKFVQSHFEPGIHAAPTQWRDGDDSWLQP